MAFAKHPMVTDDAFISTLSNSKKGTRTYCPVFIWLASNNSPMKFPHQKFLEFLLIIRLFIKNKNLKLRFVESAGACCKIRCFIYTTEFWTYIPIFFKSWYFRHHCHLFCGLLQLQNYFPRYIHYYSYYLQSVEIKMILAISNLYQLTDDT